MDNQERPLKYILFKLCLMQLSLMLPLIMMDTPILIIIIVTTLVFLPLLLGSLWMSIILSCLYDIVRPILYIIGIIITIQGQQDFFAIAFYILTALQSINIVKKLFGTICMIILALTNNKGDDL